MLKVEGLTKCYGGVEVNAGLTFSVADGEVAAVLGGNGSGKTTLVHQTAGLTKPSSGSIRLDGEDLGTAPRSARTLRDFAWMLRRHEAGVLSYFDHRIDNGAVEAEQKRQSDQPPRARVRLREGLHPGDAALPRRPRAT